MDFVFLFLGIIIGLTGGWLYFKTKVAQGAGSTRAAEEQREMLRTQLSETRQELEKERQQVLQLNQSLATSEANYRNMEERLRDQKKDLEALQEKFTHEFKNLANEIFDEKNKKSKENLGEILNPLKEKIQEFEKKVEQSNKDSLERNTALKEQLLNLKELNQQITREAENLTRALKGDRKAQGNWGEFILETILAKSGLRKGEEYVVQESLTTEEGKRYQPDVVIKLPDNKNLVIDSKVSLVAYERFTSSDDDAERAGYLKQHIISLRTHVKGLSEKNYQNLYDLGSLDFVLLFIPIEPAFSLAIQNDHQIFLDAYEKNIVMVSPSTLIATLRTIASIWKNEYQNRNAMEIARQGGALYDKFVGFTDDLVKLGASLNSTQNTYKDAMNKLSEGKGNLVKKAESIKKLGAQASKNLDPRLLDRSEDEGETNPKL